jgi:hypothetical protein
VCLATRATVVWPFDAQMAALLPAMRDWCYAHMTYVGHLDTTEFSVSVYERPSIRRPAAGVTLNSMVGAAMRGAAFDLPGTPGAPVFTSSPLAVGSTRADFRFRLVAAYSPVRYEAEGLPEGLTLNPLTGEINGRFPGAGVFKARVSATNPSGTVSVGWEVHVEDSAWFAFLNAQSSCSPGVPFDLSFGAYDEGATLDFIEVTDLTTRRTLERLPVADGQRQSWSGTRRLTLREPGPHLILMRFARYDPNAQSPYSFVDHTAVVTVTPGS